MSEDAEARIRAVWVRAVSSLSAAINLKLCGVAFSAMQRTSDPFLSYALFSSAVVNYRRAFEEVRHPKDASRASSFSIRDIAAPFDKAVHKELIKLRNEQVAHSGHELNDINVQSIRFRGEFKVQTSDGEVDEVIEHDLGARGRVSLVSGFADMAGVKKVLGHVEAVERVAIERTIEGLQAYDVAVKSAPENVWDPLFEGELPKVAEGARDVYISAQISKILMPESFSAAVTVITFGVIVDADGVSQLKADIEPRLAEGSSRVTRLA